MSSPQEKLDGVSFFLDEIENEARGVLSEKPTKATMMASLEVIVHFVGTIKGIIT